INKRDTGAVPSTAPHGTGSIWEMSLPAVPARLWRWATCLRKATKQARSRGRNLTALSGVHSPEAAQPSQKRARQGPPKLDHEPAGDALEGCPFLETSPAATWVIP